MEADFPNAALVSNDHDLWFYLIQLSDMKVRAGAETEPVRGGRAPVCMCVCVCVCVLLGLCGVQCLRCFFAVWCLVECKTNTMCTVCW
jgi:hypothetical protein